MAILEPGTVAKSTTGKVASQQYSEHCLDDEWKHLTVSYLTAIRLLKLMVLFLLTVLKATLYLVFSKV